MTEQEMFERLSKGLEEEYYPGKGYLLSAQGKLWIEERLLGKGYVLSSHEEEGNVFYRITGKFDVAAKADTLPQALYNATEKYLEENK